MSPEARWCPLPHHEVAASERWLIRCQHGWKSYIHGNTACKCSNLPSIPPPKFNGIYLKACIWRYHRNGGSTHYTSRPLLLGHTSVTACRELAQVGWRAGLGREERLYLSPGLLPMRPGWCTCCLPISPSQQPVRHCTESVIGPMSTTELHGLSRI